MCHESSYQQCQQTCNTWRRSVQYDSDVYDRLCLNRRGSPRVWTLQEMLTVLVVTCPPLGEVAPRFRFSAHMPCEAAVASGPDGRRRFQPYDTNASRSESAEPNNVHDTRRQHTTQHRLPISLSISIYNQGSGSRSSTRPRRLLRPTEGNAPSAFYISPQPLRPGEGGPSPFYIISRAIFAVSTHVSARSRGLVVQRELSAREARARDSIYIYKYIYTYITE